MKLVIKDNDGETLLSIKFTPSQGLTKDLQDAVLAHMERIHGRGFKTDAVFGLAYSNVFAAQARENSIERNLRKHN